MEHAHKLIRHGEFHKEANKQHEFSGARTKVLSGLGSAIMSSSTKFEMNLASDL